MEDARDMTIADITLAAFTICNSIRVVAYVPQITKAATDQDGAQAISFTTWGLFLVSNASAMAYALVNQADWMMASMFLANAVRLHRDPRWSAPGNAPGIAAARRG